MSNSDRILIIEDFPRTARNIANSLQKKLLESGIFKNGVQIDIAHNLGQTAYLLTKSSINQEGPYYRAIISDFVMLDVDQIRERLVREKIKLEEMLPEIPDAEKVGALMRYNQIEGDIKVLALKHFIPNAVNRLQESLKDKPQIQTILKDWNTAAVIRFIKYNYPNLPLMVCTGVTFERNEIAKELKVRTNDFEQHFQIKYIDKAYMNRNIHLYEEVLDFELFIELIKERGNSLHGELSMTTSAITANLKFYNLMARLAEVVKEENSELRNKGGMTSEDNISFH